MGGWIMSLIAPMDLIDITTIAWVTHFRSKSDSQPVDNDIEKCL